MSFKVQPLELEANYLAAVSTLNIVVEVITNRTVITSIVITISSKIKEGSTSSNSSSSNSRT